MKKRQSEKQQNYDLFQELKSVTLSPQSMEQDSSSNEKSKSEVDPLACPKCGGKSLVSARPREMGGARYCPQCPGAEPGECFYFTPEVMQ